MGFLDKTERMIFPVCSFSPEYLQEHMEELKDAMFIAKQAVKFGFVKVHSEKFDDGSIYRTFEIHISDCSAPSAKEEVKS